MLTDKQLQEIEDRASRATPCQKIADLVTFGAEYEETLNDDVWIEMEQDDVDFIVGAQSDVLSLIATIRTLQEGNYILQKSLESATEIAKQAHDENKMLQALVTDLERKVTNLNQLVTKLSQ